MARDERLILSIAVGASFVAFMNNTVITVALPRITEELGGGLPGQQWMINAYLVTLGSLILVAGSVSDVLGRGLVLRIGLIGFAIASTAIALAPTAELMIAFRALQGAAGAFLVPSSLALITSTFRDAAQARAIGVWTAATSMASIIGPVVGGLLSDFLSWRWAFVANLLPIAIVLLLILKVRLHDEPQRGRVDILGAALCALGLGGLVTALIEGPNQGWDNPLVLTCLLAGGTLFLAFIVRQRYGSAPIVPLEMFKRRNFWSGNLATAFVYAALSLNGFVLAIFLQQSVGLSATAAGLASLPMTIIMILGSSSIGALSGRFGARVFMTVGPIMMALGSLLLLTVSADFNYWQQVLPGVIVFGAGLTVTVSPLTSAVLGSVPSNRSGTASAVNNAVARVSSLVIVAVLAVIVGGQIDLSGFHRAAIVTAILLTAGALVSWIGIRSAVEPRSLSNTTVRAEPCTASDIPVTVGVTRAVPRRV
ncbi:MFS transporter [Microbacterium istanbulense]|uniref:MFS transporter n=1 Tax=Microbacterium istanbulense TaxID=3122049 RepID=A0ABU8LNT2_9MICO